MPTTSQQLSLRISALVAERRRFVHATVVRAQCPTSTRPGDSAIVLHDGTIEGFVGGQCAEQSVRTAALEVLESGESTLLRILPDGGEQFPETPGAVTVVNPCLSGGAIEVFLEPKVPAPRLVVVGATPIAEALVMLGAPLGFEMVVSDDPADVGMATAVIVASHGRGEDEAITAALAAGVGFVGLVASASRGRAVIDLLQLDDDSVRRVHSPVGLEIGARTAEEIALSILAEVVRSVRVDGLRAASAEPAESRPITAIDPVCGMTVTVGPDTATLRVGDVEHWFCNPGCRNRFAEELEQPSALREM